MKLIKMIGLISLIIGLSFIIQKIICYGAIYTPRYDFDVFDHGLYGIILSIFGIALLIYYHEIKNSS
ncbi:MAG: hypothetical protein QXF43_04170 [Nitrososphaerales archaeon]